MHPAIRQVPWRIFSPRLRLGMAWLRLQTSRVSVSPAALGHMSKRAAAGDLLEKLFLRTSEVRTTLRCQHRDAGR